MLINLIECSTQISEFSFAKSVSWPNICKHRWADSDSVQALHKAHHRSLWLSVWLDRRLFFLKWITHHTPSLGVEGEMSSDWPGWMFTILRSLTDLERRLPNDNGRAVHCFLVFHKCFVTTHNWCQVARLKNTYFVWVTDNDVNV